jgi:serralysin
LSGYGGNDTLTGLRGADIINGGDGNDILSADRELGFDNFSEIDHLFGGAGSDIISAGFGDIVDGGDGFDTMALSYVGASHGIIGDTAILFAGQAVSEGAGTIINIERFSDIALTQFDDRMVIGDQADPVTVNAWDGDDYITGQNMDITMYGGNGNDFLVGSTRNDVLYGQAGDDRLMGAAGNDVLFGGDGADRFMYGDWDVQKQDPIVEQIMDFQRGIDHIDLTDIDANLLVSGNQAFTFLGDAAFTGRAGELHTYVASGVNYLAGDVNGDGLAEFCVNLGAVHVAEMDILL